MSCLKKGIRVPIQLSLPLLVIALSAVSHAEDPELPRLKFFYFDSTNVEWVVSSDKDAFSDHLKTNPESNQLVTAIRDAVLGDEQADRARSNITGWLANRREALVRQVSDRNRIGMSEGIVTYLRAHDFSVRNLTKALKRRSGATAVELIAVHQQPSSGDADFKLKVVLENAAVETGRKGYNVDIQSPNAGYVSVVYALAVALYEVQEVISVDQPSEELPEPRLLGTEEEQTAKEANSEIERVVYEFE